MALIGTANWGVVSNAITRKNVAGVIADVTRTSAGKFAISLSGVAGNYFVTAIADDGIAAVYIAGARASITSSGFSLITLQTNGAPGDVSWTSVSVYDSVADVHSGLKLVGGASWDASAGSIASLNTFGVVTGVTYSATGKAAIALTGAPSNYFVAMIACDDNADATMAYLSGTRANVTGSGFSMYTLGIGSTVPRNSSFVNVLVFG